MRGGEGGVVVIILDFGTTSSIRNLVTASNATHTVRSGRGGGSSQCH